MGIFGKAPTEEQIKTSNELVILRDKLIERGYIMTDIKPLHCKDESIISATSCMVDENDDYGEEVIIDKMDSFWRLTIELKDNGIPSYSTTSMESMIDKFVVIMTDLREELKKEHWKQDHGM